MGYDLFIRSDPAHRRDAAVADAAEVLRAAGLRPGGGGQWLLDEDHDWMEVYLSTVAPGPAGGDALDSDGIRFNEVGCHPKPVNARTFGVVQALATALGWEIADRQLARVRREAATLPVRRRSSRVRTTSASSAPSRRRRTDAWSPAPSPAGCRRPASSS